MAAIKVDNSKTLQDFETVSNVEPDAYFILMQNGVTKKVPYNVLVERDRRLIASSEMANLKKAIASGVPEAYNFREGDRFVGPKSAYDYILSSYDHHYGGYDNQSVVSIREWTVAVNTKATHAWNASGNTDSGYATCDLQKYLEGDVLTNIKADMTALGLNLLSRGALLSNATSGGHTSSWTWYTKEIVAPSLIEVTGDSANIGTYFDIGEANRPLKAFLKYRFNELIPNAWFWTRQIASASAAAYVSGNGAVGGDSSVPYAGNVVGLIDIY